jgi:hypothetical protein
MFSFTDVWVMFKRALVPNVVLALIITLVVMPLSVFLLSQVIKAYNTGKEVFSEAQYIKENKDKVVVLQSMRFEQHILALFRIIPKIELFLFFYLLMLFFVVKFFTWFVLNNGLEQPLPLVSAFVRAIMSTISSLILYSPALIAALLTAIPYFFAINSILSVIEGTAANVDPSQLHSTVLTAQAFMAFTSTGLLAALVLVLVQIAFKVLMSFAPMLTFLGYGIVESFKRSVSMVKAHLGNVVGFEIVRGVVLGVVIQLLLVPSVIIVTISFAVNNSLVHMLGLVVAHTVFFFLFFAVVLPFCTYGRFTFLSKLEAKN